MAKILEGSSLPQQSVEFDFDNNRLLLPDVSKTHMAFTNVDTYEIKKKDDTTSLIHIVTKKGAILYVECTKEEGKYFQSTMIITKL